MSLQTRSSHSRRTSSYSVGDVPSSSSSSSINRSQSQEQFYSATNSPFPPTDRQLESNSPPPSPSRSPPLTFWGRVWRLILKFYYSLFPRSEAFKKETVAKFIEFDADSSWINDTLWVSYKFIYVLSVYGTLMCVFAGILYGIWGEAKSPPPGSHLHSFKLNSPAANTVALAVVGFSFTFVYFVFAWKFRHDKFFYKIREKHVALASLDLVVLLRVVKACFLTIYSYYDFEKEWGDWSIVLFVVLPFFFTLSSVSLLKLFEHEFLNATGLLRDFGVILVGPCFIHLHRSYKLQPSDHHDHSLLNGGLFAFAILFGCGSAFIGYIYRPHRSKMKYTVEDENNDIRLGSGSNIRRSGSNIRRRR